MIFFFIFAKLRWLSVELLFQTRFFNWNRNRNSHNNCWRFHHLFKDFSYHRHDQSHAGITRQLFVHASLLNWILIKRQTKLTKRRVQQRRSHIELKFSFTKLINWIISIGIFIGVWWWNFFSFVLIKLFTFRSAHGTRRECSFCWITLNCFRFVNSQKLSSLYHAHDFMCQSRTAHFKFLLKVSLELMFTIFSSSKNRVIDAGTQYSGRK